MHKVMGEAYTRQFAWSVGHPTLMEMFCSYERPIPSRFGGEAEIALSVDPVLGPVSCVALLARCGEANVRYPTDASCWTRYNLARNANRQSSCLCITAGGFFPASRRLFGSRLWRAKTPKSYSPANGRIQQENQSATKYFYRSPITSTTQFVLTSNTSDCQTI
jgi:hypothetical protein